ncbi:MAG: hypothetical protein JXQ73_31100 [Phycisphaerae bacterium]|nr:hypothetical protein [Phycisphaerae bacterium]
MRLGDDRGFAPVAKADDSPAAPAPAAKTDPGKPNRFAPTNRSPSEPARKTGWGPILSSDRMFHCTSCEHDFTLSNNEANTQLREARMRAKEGQSPAIRCPKCGRDTALQAMKCAKCGAAITASGDPRSYSMKEFFDHCPKCGYSHMRENMLNALRRRKESGRPIDESKLPALMKKALDDARASGEWKD